MSWGTGLVVHVGGLMVIVSIAMIFLFLLATVVQLLRPAKLEQFAAYPAPGGGASLGYALDEYRSVALRVTADHRALFFRTADGAVLEQQRLLPAGAPAATAYAMAEPESGVFLLGLDNGEALIARARFEVAFDADGVRRTVPVLDYPLGPATLSMDPAGRALRSVSLQWSEEQAGVLAETADGRLLLSLLEVQDEEVPGGGDAEVLRRDYELPTSPGEVVAALLDLELRYAYVLQRGGDVSMYTLGGAVPRLLQRTRAVAPGERITSAAMLSGGISLLIGDSRGRVTQWMPVRGAQNQYMLARVRELRPARGDAADVVALIPEHYRKGFFVAAADGHAGLHHATSERTLWQQRIATVPLRLGAVSPRADALLLEEEGGALQFWHVDNPHPEYSWGATWGKVWYEGRSQPEYIWQSSSASGDFEPKFSLMPLGFGTLKAAFYAMLFSIPVAILGAIYTAYFMAPRMRMLVKPGIEIMEALPTVILGFLAGLWLAPLMEAHLAGFFLFLLLAPLSVLLACRLWRHLPPALRAPVPEGYEAALLVPVVLLAGALAVGLGASLEVAMFGGSLPLWLTNELGIGFDQRNSLVVGIAMGFAVIPTIFSISEDAVYAVPHHLSDGSMALGATRWQTMIRVILLTASPGIFSAVMIGLGRAVGETMIVVMATGNTPIMDLNIFQGFRAMSANIAVEMPEAAVGSSHYHILYLAALILFIITFAINTAADIVRQRLRRRYSSL